MAVLNMKGGVGKTTISAHVMRVLYHQHRVKTLLVDLDPQFNLSQTLIKRPAYEKIKALNRTILSAMEPPPPTGLHEIKTSTSPPPNAEDIILRLRGIVKSSITLDLLPGDFGIVQVQHDR